MRDETNVNVDQVVGATSAATGSTDKGAVPELPADIGEQIRALRQAKKWTLSRLAAEAGCSVGLLSQVERGTSRLSVRRLRDIALALGVNISWFMPDSAAPPEEAGLIVRKGLRRYLNYGSGVKDALLTPSLDRQLELLESTIAPGAGSGEEPYSHDGEEAGIVLRGRLALWIDGRTFHLNEGDCFSFESSRPHRYWNPGETDAVIIWAITPPSF
jgi:transcriptional regulator with XRE-family HTH domain